MNPRELDLARQLRDAGFGVRGIHTVIDGTPLSVCEWCTDRAATVELFHDTGTVLCCPHCVLAAAAAAADESRDGWFRVELTHRGAA